eukprot:g8725.t1
MVTEPKDILKRVTSSDTDIQRDGVRCLKNEIIGNPTRKQCFIQLGAVPKIVRILSQSQDQCLAVQAAAALGSFAYGNELGVDAIVKSGGISHLLKTLLSENLKLVEAGLRSLKMIFQEAAPSPREAVFVSPAFDRLVSFLDWTELSFMEDALSVLSKCCKTKQHQELLLEAGILPRMMKLLFSQKSTNQPTAISGLAKMSHGNEAVCSYLAKRDDVIKILMRFCRTGVPQVQLESATVLVNIITSSTSVLKSTSFDEELASILVSLLDDCDQVPGIIADLISSTKSVQLPLRSEGFFRRLMEMTSDVTRSLTGRTGAIKAVGMLYKFHSDCKLYIGSSPGIFQLLNHLESELIEIRLAALYALEAIVSKSEELETPDGDQYTRTPPIPYSTDSEIRLKELGCVAAWLFYIDHPDLLKKAQNEALSFLLRYAQHPEPAVQFKAIWSISNFIPLTEEITDLIMSELPWSVLSELTRDLSQQVQQVGLRWLRGLCERDNLISSVIYWSNGELLPLVSKKLDIHEFHSLEVLKLAMDVAVAIACSDVEHQTAFMGSEIPPRLLDCLEKCDSDIVRQRAVDCVIKLTYKDVLPCLGEDGDHADVRKMYLLELGFEETLRKLIEDELSDGLKVKVNEALSYLERR